MTVRNIPARTPTVAPRAGGGVPFLMPAFRRGSVAPAMEPRTVIGNALYVDGRRVSSPPTLQAAADELRTTDGAMAWIGLYQPDEEDLNELGRLFDLHELAIEDAIQAHQRSKLERYDDTLFVVLRAARYLDDIEEIEFGELHIFTGPNFIITVRHGRSPDLAQVRRRLEADPDMLLMGPEAVMYAILDAVVDSYAPVLEGLSKDIEEIEGEVFTGNAEVSRRIYELSQEVVEFQRAVRPLRQILGGLAAGFTKYGVAEDLQEYLRDVADHASDAGDRIEGFRLTLRDVLTLNATLVAQRQNEEMKNLAESSNEQNEEMKKVSAWAGILFMPTLISSMYGMNFQHMPELSWAAGYPFALVLMVVASLIMWVVFRRKGWI